MASAAPSLPRPRLAVCQAANDQAACPDDHAIVVGIDHYLAGINSLQGALNDCQLFCEWLVRNDGGGLDPNNIDFYGSVAPCDKSPFRDQIEDLLLEFFAEHSQTGKPVGRRLYLFFSGHGVASASPTQEECGLVMANAVPHSIRALAGAETAARVRVAALFEEVVLIMDCCREVANRGVIECGLPSYGDPTLAKRPYLHVLAAGWGATTAERLLPHPLDPNKPHLHHGLLTHALLKALHTARDDSGNVTAASLKAVVRKTVQELLEPGDLRLPLVRFDEDLQPMCFGASRGVEVQVELTGPVQDFRIRHGAEFRLLEPETERSGRSAKVWLAPGLHLFEGLDAAGAVVRSEVVHVLAGGAHVDL